MYIPLLRANKKCSLLNSIGLLLKGGKYVGFTRDSDMLSIIDTVLSKNLMHKRLGNNSIGLRICYNSLLGYFVDHMFGHGKQT